MSVSKPTDLPPREPFRDVRNKMNQGHLKSKGKKTEIPIEDRLERSRLYKKDLEQGLRLEAVKKGIYEARSQNAAQGSRLSRLEEQMAAQAKRHEEQMAAQAKRHEEQMAVQAKRHEELIAAQAKRLDQLMAILEAKNKGSISR